MVHTRDAVDGCALMKIAALLRSSGVLEASDRVASDMDVQRR